MSPSARALRLVLATATLQSLAGAGLVGSLRGMAAAAGRAASPDPVVAAPAGLEAFAWAGLAACSLWFAASVVVTARDLARHPARPTPRQALGCLRPAVVRSLLVVLVGGTLVTPSLRASAELDPGWAVLDGLPVPGLPTGPAPAPAPAPAPERSPAPATVRVAPGDSLWRITAGLLGPHVPDARVAAAWPLLRRANRDVLGRDPDLVLPGTVLRVPAALQHDQHQHTQHPAGAAR
jgi:nucleoid-associated protein YgaU